MMPRTHPSSRTAGSGPLPAQAGIGLKPRHFADALEPQHSAGWFEVHPENYLVAGGPLLNALTRVRERYPLSFHSVGMSPGSADGVNVSYIQRLRALCDRFQPALVSDHLSWSRWQHIYLNDLLPLPYTEESLAVVTDNVDQIQNILGRKIAIENPSLYLQMPGAEMDECEFLVRLARNTGCMVLLDINNLVVNANNVRLDVESYLRRMPAAIVSELHLAGHKVEQHQGARLCIDDHGSAVSDEVWSTYAFALQHFGALPTLIEWDTNVPEFGVLMAEADKATAVLGSVAVTGKRYA